ncbi:MAG: hypothetical protein DRP00_03250 [Candidatus Aenigmatarchaeota archaeon]|nr:MAG: hypothetical protein DRP00_03250 [Candidatus Aenigmarchaeota archaeon]
MALYSSHAIIVMSRRYLLNKEHEEFGFLFPGGKFTDNDVRRAKSEGWYKVSREVLERKLREELNPTKILIGDLVEVLPDEIVTENYRFYPIEQMWFYLADIEPHNFYELKRRTSIPLRLMSRKEIEKEVISNAMKKVLKKLPRHYP